MGIHIPTLHLLVETPTHYNAACKAKAGKAAPLDVFKSPTEASLCPRCKKCQKIAGIEYKADWQLKAEKRLDGKKPVAMPKSKSKTNQL